MERLEAHRHFYADLITTAAGAAKNERLKAAFASTPREHFVGAGPWKVFAGGNYVETPTDDPAFLYQDVVVALAPERRINNGQPVLHAVNLAALDVKQGERSFTSGLGPDITRQCWRGLLERRERLWRMRLSMTWRKTLSITSAIERLKPLLTFSTASLVPSLEIEEGKRHLHIKD